MRQFNFKAICLGLLLAGIGGSYAQVAPAATPQGVISVREFRPTDAGIASLTNLASFPNNPDIIDHALSFEWPAGVDGAPPASDVKNNYGVQILGYFYPPTTGNYTFAIASDDNGRLYLSTDADPAKKTLIAQEDQWSGVRDFSGTARRVLVDEATGRYNNVSVPILLDATKHYYIEAIMSEGGGGDNLAVTYTTDGSLPQAGAEPIPGSQLRSFDRADGPLTLTTSPTSQTVPAGSLVSFSVGVPNGTPPYTYEWLRNGEVITDINGFPVGGTRYSIPRVESTDNGASFTVRITNPAGSITTPAAILTVTSDTTPPTMRKVTSSDSFNQVIITYSEPMDDAAIVPSNYTISGGVTVTAAEFQQFDLNDPSAVTNKVVVRLSTSLQPQATQMTLTVNAANVKDLFGNAVSPNTASFRSWEFRTGVVLYKRWLATTVSALTNDPVRFESPDVVETRTLVETGGDFADNFSSQMKGFFIPATTGDYVFYGASDDNMSMFLSTDASPANLHLILADIGWQNSREWTGVGGATTTGNGVDTPYVYRRGQVNDADPFGPWIGPTENRSDQFLTSMTFANARGGIDTSNPWPITDPATGNAKITLTAGQRYYFEVYHQEGGGGDRAQVTFKLATAADPANGTASAMTGNLIGAVVDPSSFPPTITTRPTGVNVFTKGDSFSYSVVADNPASGALSYQWYLNKKAIPGATSATLDVTNADVDDVGDYSVDVINVNGRTSSRPDDGARAIMRGAFVVEAEDFNYNAGQSVAAASTMPLATNYYTGLDGTPGIDFLLTNQSTTDAAANGNMYRNGWISNSVTIPFPTAPNALGNIDIIDNNGDRNRGDFTLTTNYKMGWGSPGEWYQYTRNFPPGNYNAVLGVSRDGLTTNGISFALGIVTAGANTETATVTPVGTVTSSFTGGWSSNDLLALRAADGTPAVYALGANSTVRLTINTGDADLDYILFYPVSGPPPGPTIAINRNATGPVITYTGVLHSSDTVNGTYTPVNGATSPYQVPTDGTMRFFRSFGP